VVVRCRSEVSLGSPRRPPSSYRPPPYCRADPKPAGSAVWTGGWCPIIEVVLHQGQPFQAAQFRDDPHHAAGQQRVGRQVQLSSSLERTGRSSRPVASVMTEFVIANLVRFFNPFQTGGHFVVEIPKVEDLQTLQVAQLAEKSDIGCGQVGTVPDDDLGQYPVWDDRVLGTGAQGIEPRFGRFDILGCGRRRATGNRRSGRLADIRRWRLDWRRSTRRSGNNRKCKAKWSCRPRSLNAPPTTCSWFSPECPETSHFLRPSRKQVERNSLRRSQAQHFVCNYRLAACPGCRLPAETPATGLSPTDSLPGPSA
jgi:hypothetical protein